MVSGVVPTGMPWEPLPGTGADPQPINGALDRVVRAMGGVGAETLQKVLAAWSEVAGDDVASRTRPVVLQHGRLVVEVDDPAWVTELRYREAEILAQFGAVVGTGQVTALELRVVRRGGR